MLKSKNTIILLIIMVLVFSASNVLYAHGNSTNGPGSMMGSGYNNQINDFGNGNFGFNGMMGMGMMMGNRMFGGMYSNMSANRNYSLSAVGMTEDQLKKQVISIIESRFGPEYIVGDIFIFNNSPYYISVIEKDTGHGAFELLYDPYRGIVYPEMGPNMMWNTKYNMNNVMIWGTPIEDNIIDRDKALERAREFANQNDFNVADEGHHFYGYYTFHTEVNEETTGMLSVNAYTGQVWYHNWHINLDKVLEVEHTD